MNPAPDMGAEEKLGRAVKTGGTEIQCRLAAVRERVAAAAARAGRDPSRVTIVGITKGVDLARIQGAIDAGLIDLGENRIQEWLLKSVRVSGGVRWHYVGRLQTNKARYLARGISVLHSLDRAELLDAIEPRWCSWAAGLQPEAGSDPGPSSASTAAIEPVCLVQVNVAGEKGKAGLAPRDLGAFLERIAAGGLVRVGGLMTIAPYTDRPEDVRWVFAALRELRDQASGDFPQLGLEHLSMGMSGDFEVAVEEGATMVRIGTAIFGARR
jgi:PLP dependent protein